MYQELKRCIVLSVMVLFAAPTFAQVNPAGQVSKPAPITIPADELQHINQLISVTGTDKIGSQMINALSSQMIAGVKSAYPNSPDAVRAAEIINEETQALFEKDILNGKGGLIDIIRQSYARYFSDQEIQGLIAFYQSPLGKKVISVMPVVMQENMAGAQEIMRKEIPILQQRIQNRFKLEHINLNQNTTKK
jgi:uncharacterized protein